MRHKKEFRKLVKVSKLTSGDVLTMHRGGFGVVINVKIVANRKRAQISYVYNNKLQHYSCNRDRFLYILTHDGETSNGET